MYGYIFSATLTVIFDRGSLTIRLTAFAAYLAICLSTSLFPVKIPWDMFVIYPNLLNLLTTPLAEQSFDLLGIFYPFLLKIEHNDSAIKIYIGDLL